MGREGGRTGGILAFRPLRNLLSPCVLVWLRAWMGGLLRLVQRGGDWAGSQPAQAPPRCTKRNSPPINGQCRLTNFILLVVTL